MEGRQAHKMGTVDQKLYQLRVVLREISPLVWRRILVPSSTTLADLHEVLQIVFDWDGSRLHSFRIHGKEYAGESGKPREVVLSALRLVPGESFVYEYDYFAGWRCDVRLEKVLATDPKRRFPICTGGRWPSPPDDCSGPQEYLERLEQHRLGPSLEELDDLNTLAKALLEVTKESPEMACKEFLEKLEIHEVVERVIAFESFGLTPFCRRPINKRLREEPQKEQP